MSKELITKEDYQIFGIKKNSTPNEINSAYEKLCLEYHPEKIRKEKLRELNNLEIKKYKEIEKVYKKFDVKHWKYKCVGWKSNGPCPNEFYPCLWEKVENGRRNLFCFQECYNSKYKYNSRYDELVEKYRKEDKEWERKKLAEAKKYLEDMKVREIENIKKYFDQAKVKQEDSESNNQNFEQEINNISIKDRDDLEYIETISAISSRVEKDIKSKSKYWENDKKCDKCQGIIGENGYGSVDNHGNHRNFCSKNCLDTFSESWTSKSIVVIKRNAFVEILKWMKKQGVESISFDQTSGQLLVEYSGKIKKPVEEKDLTPELKEIKDYYQENSENNKLLSLEAIQQEIDKSGVKPKNEGNGMLIFGILVAGVIIFVLMGVIFHKKRTKRY